MYHSRKVPSNASKRKGSRGNEVQRPSGASFPESSPVQPPTYFPGRVITTLQCCPLASPGSSLGAQGPEFPPGTGHAGSLCLARKTPLDPRKGSTDIQYLCTNSSSTASHSGQGVSGEPSRNPSAQAPGRSRRGREAST